ncbi:unnamed protein product [Gongylonema pulchrum]|uniref:Uncharacterized protein n=1 Tax=Gongylonema pulchrum TaxID=637853 RepID=A0A183DAS9_9BILA|nr:unnamed protein product [Gongylonema pulchrum]
MLCYPPLHEQFVSHHRGLSKNKAPMKVLAYPWLREEEENEETKEKEEKDVNQGFFTTKKRGEDEEKEEEK